MYLSKSSRLIPLMFAIIMIIIATGCAPAKKNTYYQKRKSASKVNTSQLGRNKYYFSSGYQKKLTTGYKKK